MAEFWVDEKRGESVERIWDKLVLGNITFPGICKLECGVALDMQQSKVQTEFARGTTPPKFKLTLTDNGYNAAKLKATIEIWEKDQWEDLEETLPKFSPRSGEKQGSSIGDDLQVEAYTGKPATNPQARRLQGSARDAFDIIHPAANLLGINHVIVTSIDLPPIQQQTLTIMINMIQYFPATGRRILHGTGGALTGSKVPEVKPADNL